MNQTITDVRKTTKDLATVDSSIVRKWHVSNPLVPKIYGLPKIHKEGRLKIRPIVSNIGASTERLAKWLVAEYKKMGPVGGKSVQNSGDFVQRIRDVKLKRTESLVSFDEVGLFPSIPVPEAINCLED